LSQLGSTDYLPTTKPSLPGRLFTLGETKLQAANDNINPDEPLRLADAIKFGIPHGGMTVSGLRREAARGRLVIEQIANKDFTTLRAIEEMRKSCRVNQNPPASGSGPRAKIAKTSGLSCTGESKLALDAAMMTVKALKSFSKNI
jgi:hypothetical protein